MFWNNKNVEKTSDERISKLESRILKVESDLLAVILDQKIIRDKVLRKIQFKHTEEEQPEETKDLYSSVLLTDNGSAHKSYKYS
jgi:hypothetical protein